MSSDIYKKQLLGQYLLPPSASCVNVHIRHHLREAQMNDAIWNLEIHSSDVSMLNRPFLEEQLRNTKR